jgi:hypothetical protein
LKGLPSNAGTRLGQLKAAFDEMCDLSSVAGDRLMAADEAVQRAQLRIAELEGRGYSTEPVSYEQGQPIYADGSARGAQKRLEQARSEQHAVQKLYDERGKRRTHIGRLIDSVNAYIEAHAGVGMHDLAPASVSDADLPAQLEKAHARRERLLADLEATQAAPLTKAEVIEKAKAEIDALADRGVPSLQRLFEDGGNISWPEKTDQIGNGLRTIFAVLPKGGGIAEIDGSLYLPGVDSLALVVWAHRDAIVAKLAAEIEQHYEQHPKALSREDRQKRVAEIRAKLFECERAEVAIVDRMGDLMQLREDIDPAALLGVHPILAA